MHKSYTLASVSQSTVQHSSTQQLRRPYPSAYTCLTPSTMNREQPLLRLPKRGSAFDGKLADFDTEPILTCA